MTETQNNKDLQSEEAETEQSPGGVQPDVASDEDEDGAPVLDEEDLEDNDISGEDAENIEWEEPKKDQA